MREMKSWRRWQDHFVIMEKLFAQRCVCDVMRLRRILKIKLPADCWAGVRAVIHIQAQNMASE